MGLVVRGTHNGREYDLSEPVDTEIEAGAIKRREERNGHYSDLHVVDLDQFEEDAIRKLPRYEQEAAAAKGHPVAARVLGQTVAPAKEGESEGDLRAKIAELESQLAERNSAQVNSPQGGTDGESNSKGGGPFDSTEDDSGKSGGKSRSARGKASE